jgi:hypothetical protein
MNRRELLQTFIAVALAPWAVLADPLTTVRLAEFGQQGEQLWTALTQVPIIYGEYADAGCECPGCVQWSDRP